MGCCESCFSADRNEFDEDGPRETDKLINPANGQTQPESFGETHVTPQASSSQHKKGDEQSALSKILQDTASNVIDVAGVEGRGIEQHEYHDKARQYSNRVNMVLSSTGRGKKYRTQLPPGAPSVMTELSGPPISVADIELIKTAALAAALAVKGIAVDHKEDLVVPFGVP